MSLKEFIIFVVLLAGILLAVSLLVSPLMGIFIASIITCLWIEYQDKGCKKT